MFTSETTAGVKNFLQLLDLGMNFVYCDNHFYLLYFLVLRRLI